MSKLSDFNMLKEQAEGKVKGHKLNYDEFGAYILSLLQYNIQIRFNHLNRNTKIIGIGPRGVIYQLQNMLFQYAPYPNDIGGPNMPARDMTMYANIDGSVYQLFDEPVKLVRPRKRNCSFGITLEELSVQPELEDIEF